MDWLGLAEKDARLYAEQLGQLALRSWPTAELASDALEIALAYDITAYDAAYVALTARLGVLLVTADEQLARALAGSPFDVRWLGAHATPPLSSGRRDDPAWPFDAGRIARCYTKAH